MSVAVAAMGVRMSLQGGQQVPTVVAPDTYVVVVVSPHGEHTK